MPDAVMQGKVAEVIYRRAIEIFSGMLKLPIFVEIHIWQWWWFISKF